MSELIFPPTNEICSRLAFGTGRLHARDLANMEATIRRAYDIGIRHFDSSVHYDNSAPHAALARLIRDVPADNLFISTKIGRMRPAFPDYRSLYRSREALLGVTHECYRMLLGKIDLLQIHEADWRLWWEQDAPDDQHAFVDPNSEYDFQGAPVCDVVRHARSNGVCRYIGITGNSSGPLSRVADAIEVDSVMCAYNLDPVFRGTAEHVVPVTRRKGQFLMAAGVFQAGRYRDPQHLPEPISRFDRLKSAFSAFDAIQRESGLPAIELLARWTLSVTNVGKWVMGASNPDQLEELVAYLAEGPLPLDVQSALAELAVPGFDWSWLYAGPEFGGTMGTNCLVGKTARDSLQEPVSRGYGGSGSSKSTNTEAAKGR